MNERVPTREQQAAIRAAGRDVLVEAGAGTGKTGVMVDRYCRLIREEGVSPDGVLVVTFTDKAAAELRRRIGAVLGELPTGAWVTTIHGFCNRLLSGHPVAVGIDPRYRVLDAAETERAAREAFDEALEEFLAGGEEARERTVAAFDVAGLRAMVVATHAELRSRGIAEPRLPEQPEPDLLGAVRAAAQAASAAAEELTPGSANRELVERALEVLSAAADGGDAPGLDELAALRSDSSAKAMTAYCEAIDAATARAAEAGEGGEAYRHVAVLLDLFSARFEAVKRRRAGIDFEDLQLLAAHLLEHTEIGAAYKARFSHLLVDEFQDTNRLQLRLIEALRGPGSELMTVGDELQSIYGFRHADLDVFREQRRAVEASAEAEAIPLSGNFRSRPEVVGAVNAIGERLLGDAFRPLRVGAEPPSPMPAGDGPAPELLLTARDGWDEEGIDLEPAIDARTPLNCLAEARFVAMRLRELADAGVERGEMVVLLRAFTHLDAYEDALERAGLRPYVVGGRGYWSQQQVADVCALLATIANPLDDQALFGALASPACGAAPDTLWLLRAAAGRNRHIWPTLEKATGLGESEPAEPERLEQIPEPELALLRRFAETLAELRKDATRLPLADLVDAAVTRTGYDLAVLMRPAGEARFANVRKLMRLAAEFEVAEGRDLRGLLDFLAARAEADAEAQAATAIEGHDGVRIMTVHSAKGLEFGVVAVPHLSRSLLAGSWPPLLTIGREPEEPRVGMQLRRMGAAAVNLYAHEELRDEAKGRAAEEELRLFHVAATRARERLILSGIVKPKAGNGSSPGTPVVERIAAGFGIDRESDSTVEIPAPLPRDGLDAAFEPSELAVRVNLPSPERAAELTVTHRETDAAPDLGEGPAPLVEWHPPTVPSRPLSYTALDAHDSCPYRFYVERVLDLGAPSSPADGAAAPADGTKASVYRTESSRRREEGTGRGSAVHSLLEWSRANGWREPGEELVRRHAVAAGLDPDRDDLVEDLLSPVRGWLDSGLFRERVASAARVRAEAPILLGVDGSVLRGSIDLLVEGAGSPPLVVDYKTDRLDGENPARHAERYAIQRDVYALAAATAADGTKTSKYETSGSRRQVEVEVAYVFLERPEQPVLFSFGGDELGAARERLEEAVARIGAGDFRPAPPERRDWALCRGCPALGGLCSGPGGE